MLVLDRQLLIEIDTPFLNIMRDYRPCLPKRLRRELSGVVDFGTLWVDQPTFTVRQMKKIAGHATSFEFTPYQT
ncbi:MAG: hypothetical protein BGN95_14910 [Sphingomonas sp. 66-10]|nr:MAG: hypothetical protein BGN95_14910 [Sphingomonas sp. 66-10]